MRMSMLLSVVALGVFGLGTQAFAGDKEVIAYRESIMKAMNEHSAALGQILSGAVPDDNAVTHLEAIALLASTAPKAFEPKVQGGESKPEVWTNWADFSQRMDVFVKNTAEAARVANEEGKDAALSNILDALDCKSCHDRYRVEKKK